MADFLCGIEDIENYIDYYVVRDVFDGKSRKLIGSNVKVSKKMIDSLNSYKIKAVWLNKETVNQDQKKKVMKSDPAIQLNNLDYNRENLKNIFSDVSKEILHKRDRNKPVISISQKSLQKIQGTIENILNTISENPFIAMSLPILNKKDGYIIKHSVNVTYMALCLVSSYPAILDIFKDPEKGINRFDTKKNIISSLDLVPLGMCCFLHDIGLITMLDEVLEDQYYEKDHRAWDEIKKHPQIGHDMLFGKNINAHALLGVKYHHENFDGSGYPFGIEGYKIHPFSRIINLVESYESMTSDTPGRPAKDFRASLGEILSLSGKKYDSEFAKFFVDMVLGGNSGLVVDGELI